MNLGLIFSPIIYMGHIHHYPCDSHFESQLIQGLDDLHLLHWIGSDKEDGFGSPAYLQ
jgi:hypothetical protein